MLRDVARRPASPSTSRRRSSAATPTRREVRADETAAGELGVTGVPYFLINGAWPMPGAQDVETMVIVLRRAWSRLGH